MIIHIKNNKIKIKIRERNKLTILPHLILKFHLGHINISGQVDKVLIILQQLLIFGSFYSYQNSISQIQSTVNLTDIIFKKFIKTFRFSIEINFIWNMI